jgi:hypothetical protein
MQSNMMWSTSAVVTAATALVAFGCGGTSHSGTAAGTASAGSGAQTTKSKAADASPPGDIPDNQAYVTYAAPAALGFKVKVPEGWSRSSKVKTVTFTDKLNTIMLSAGPAGAHAGRASIVHRTAGPAKRLVYDARSTPDPVTGKTRTDTVERYVFTKGGRTAVLTLSGPKGADNVDPWRLVTDSFRWTS